MKKGTNTLIDFKMVTVTAVNADEIVTRRATLADAQGIYDLVKIGVREGQLLHRTLDSIREGIENWIVAEHHGKIVGIGALVEMNPALVEIRSLAVSPEYRQYGIGGKVVTALEDEARAREIAAIFALTRAVLFFEKQGYIISEKENFPEKVWYDCSNCPAQFACDEVAMVKSISSSQ